MDDLILEKIKIAVDPYCRIAWEDLQAISAYFKVKTYPAKTVIKQSGTTEKIIRFVLEGEIGKFDKEGKKEYCEDIFLPGQLASDFISYIKDEPCSTWLMSYTPCKVVEFHKDHRRLVVNEIPAFSELSSAFLKIEVLNSLSRNKFLRKPAVEKTRWVDEHRSDVFKVAPVRDVAQCLMMSPEHFSRLRNEKCQKGFNGFSAKGFLKGLFPFLY